MKKNLASLVLVLGMFSVASALTAFMADRTEVLPGETISIGLYTDVPAGSMTLVSIVETPCVGGTASNHWVPIGSAGWNWPWGTIPGTVVNAGGLLIENVIVKTSFGSPPIDGVVLGFSYTVPQLDESTRWTIGPGEGTNNVGGIRPDAVGLHITPEPATVLLFAIGAVMLRRKRS